MTTFVPLEVQPVNPPFSGRIEDGRLWWELNERDNWLRDDENIPPYKPGDVVKLPEGWRVYGWSGNSLGEFVVRIEYRDGRAVEEIAVELPYGELVRLTDWQPASTMPAWAMRERTVTAVTLELRDGVWGWLVEVS